MDLSSNTLRYCTPRALSLLQQFGPPTFSNSSIWSYEELALALSLSPLLLSAISDTVSDSVSDVTSESVASLTSETSFKAYQLKRLEITPDSKVFVIKSYNANDIHASFEHGIWTSTEFGNKRLQRAYEKGPVYLFFLVNASGRFCGIAKMTSGVDFSRKREIWMEPSRWNGIFSVEWLMMKDVPNKLFQHLRNPLNESKVVTNSRDTQEIPLDVAISVLKICKAHRSTYSSILV